MIRAERPFPCMINMLCSRTEDYCQPVVKKNDYVQDYWTDG